MTGTHPEFQFKFKGRKLHFLCCDCGKSPCDLLAWHPGLAGVTQQQEWSKD